MEALEWYRNIPPVTRAVFTVTLALSVVPLLGVGKNDMAYAFLPSRVAAGELWRPLTSLLYAGPLSIPLVGSTVYLASISTVLETHHFGGSRGYAWLLFVASTALLALFPVVRLKFPGDALGAMLVHLWSRYQQDVQVAVFFVRVPMHYMSLFVMMANAMQGKPLVPDVVGVLLAHVVFFCNSVLPLTSGVNPIAFPFVREITI